MPFRTLSVAMPMNQPLIRVVCAIILNEKGEIFIARRREDKKNPGEWEFPGGKMDEGENEAEALEREIKEELAVQIHCGEILGSVKAESGGRFFELIALVASCDEEIRSSTDHSEWRWLGKDQMNEIELSKLDRDLLEVIELP